jgi:CheY-like chemotaxis protein
MTQRNILIVEDNDLQQALYGALSRKFDLNMKMVKSCVDALRAVSEGDNYDLILMDLGLADTNGCDCARRIRDFEKTRGTHTPIVAVTGHTTDEYKNDCFDSGMDGFLCKPFSLDEFGAAINKHARTPVSRD